MKILYYNWTHLDEQNLGGGVRIYQKNLADSMCEMNHEIYYLNSGFTYNGGGTYIEQLDNVYNIRCYEIINSPVLAPVQQSGKNIDCYLNDKSLKEILINFIKENGPFDIIHFNNLEGLSLSCLELKEEFPNTKLIYSLHNYFPFCSRVDLLQNSKSNAHNCDKKSYKECISCYKKHSYNATITRRQLKNSGKLNLKNKASLKIYDTFVRDKENESLYRNFEESNVSSINKNIDIVLAVSDRVKEIAVSRGLDPSKILTSYIGTLVAEHPLNKCNTNINAEPFNVIYMGYMKKPKGFNFFLDSITELSKNNKDIHFKLVAKYKTKSNYKELFKVKMLQRKYNNIELINGYTSSNQKDLLQGCNLGVVPVLWEDNLPQVAIEQIAYGVPILVSDLGGAKELVNNNDFIFKAGNQKEFIEKLLKIKNDRKKLEEFWENNSKLTTMDKHIKDILNIYAK